MERTRTARKREFSARRFITHYSKLTWVFLAAFLIFDLVLNIMWMKMIPMAKAPDEPVRIILSDYVFFHGQLPNAWDPAVRIREWGFSYALRPMLVNILGAFNMWVVSWFTDDPYALLLSVRIISAFSKTAMLYFLFRTCEWLGWKPRWGWCVVLICSLVPQLTFLAGYHNNDTFCMCCVSAVLYCWVRGMKEKWTWADCIKFAIAMGLTIQSYYNAYPYILFSIPLFFMTAFHRHMAREEKIEMWKKTGVIVLITFLIAGWWFIRNIILYNGDVLGSKTRLEMGEKFATFSKRPSIIFKPIRQGLSYWDTMFFFNGSPFDWATKTFMSSFALLGLMDFLMPAELYRFFSILVVTGLALFVIQFVVWIVQALWYALKKHCADHEANQNILFFLFISICAVMVIMLSLYYSWTDDFQPQGRYIMPGFTSVILAVVAGYRFAFKTVSKIFFKYEKYGYAVLSWAGVAYLAFCLGWIQLYSYQRVQPQYSSLPRFTQNYLKHREKYNPNNPDGQLTEREIELYTQPEDKSQTDSASQDPSHASEVASQASSQTTVEETQTDPAIPAEHSQPDSNPDVSQPTVDPSLPTQAAPEQPSADQVVPDQAAPEVPAPAQTVDSAVDSAFEEPDSGEQSFE